MENLNQLILDSEQLARWFNEKINGLPVSASLQIRVACGCLDQAMEHHQAIVLLIARGLNGSAFSLIRLMTEAYARGVWIRKCATDDEIDNFVNGKVPKYFELLKAIEERPSHNEGTLSKFKDQHWTTLNSFTHTGYQQVIRRQTDGAIEANYPHDEIRYVLCLSNNLAAMSAVAIFELADRADLMSETVDKMKTDDSMRAEE